MKQCVVKINNFLNSINENRTVVGLDGYSGIGKTTISNELERINSSIKVLHLDDYIVTANTKEKLEKHLSENKEYLELEWKNVGANSLETLKKEISDFKEKYDKNILLIEGIFFSDPMFDGLFDKIIFIDGDEKLADERRINREKERWGDKYFPEDHPDSFARLFKLAWKRYLEIYKPNENADFIVKNNKMKKILIIGDAGRGKTTFAEKLSEKLGIQHYSLDDFYWEVKFTKPRGKEIDIEMARECFQKGEWIVEGGTRRMIILGLPKADQIFYLTYKNIFQQIWVLYKRNRSRDNENLKNLFDLIVYQIKKKHKIGKHKNMESFEDLLKPYSHKVTRLESFEEINSCL